jgi:hypothetical protein
MRLYVKPIAIYISCIYFLTYNLSLATFHFGGLGMASRTAVTTVRFDERIRYLADIAARIQRRNFTEFLEWAVEEALKTIPIKAGDNPYGDNDEPLYGDGPGAAVAGRKIASVLDYSIAARSNHLWDVDEADRFFKLATMFPYLLDIDEQRLWKRINESPLSQTKDGKLDVKLVRKHWAKFNSETKG